MQFAITTTAAVLPVLRLKQQNAPAVLFLLPFPSPSRFNLVQLLQGQSTQNRRKSVRMGEMATHRCQRRPG